MFINKKVSRRAFLASLSAIPFAGVNALTRNESWEDELRTELNEDPSVKTVIFLNMSGGMSHIDTLDPKPDSQFKSVRSSAKNISLSETFANTAKQMDKAALLRSVHSGAGDHERASYLLHTGTMPNAAFRDIPSQGAIIAFAKQKQGPWFPGHITVGGRGGIIGRGGFLGTRYDSFHISNVDNPLSNLTPPGNVSSLRQVRRKAFLDLTNQHFSSIASAAALDNWNTLHNSAVDFMNSDKLDAFDWNTASKTDQKNYGDTKMGKAMLMSRRLAEMEVPFIEITLGGWDTHSSNKERVQELSSLIDKPLATLLSDLENKKMLSSTVVMLSSEFGRTPKMAANGNGRDHYPSAWTTLFAGGNFRRGVVYGSTDEKGAKVTSNPVSVARQTATLFAAAGISLTTDLYNSEGRPFSLANGEDPIEEILKQ